jgi:hypothetical protein
MEQYSLFAALDQITAPLPQPEPTAIVRAATEFEEPPQCDWAQFICENGRVPFVTDARKPWTYPGWMMHYRLLAEECQITPPRWEYWARTKMAGRLLDEPIPRLDFEDDCGERTEGFKVIDKAMRLVDDRTGDRSVRVLLEWLMFALGLSRELPDVPDKLHEDLYRTIDLGPLLRKPADYIGGWISAHKGRWNPTAFFPTPHSIVEMICRMTYGEGDQRSQTVCDPCAGTGRFLLHASNYSLRLYGNDIDNTVVMATKVNGALYAPWLVRPFPDHFFV